MLKLPPLGSLKSQKMNVLFVGPHPDDVELGAGGTVKKFTNQGWNVFILVITKSRDPIAAKNRKAEALEAANILGVDKQAVSFLNFPDGQLNQLNAKTIQDEIYFHISSIEPHLIFGPADIDQHDDHIVVNHALKQAGRTVGLLLYHVHHHVKWKKITKEVCVDVTEFWNVKVDACLAHKTEVDRGSITRERLDEIKNRSTIEQKVYEFFNICMPVGYSDADYFRYVNQINNESFSLFWIEALNLHNASEISLNFVVPTVMRSGPPLEAEGRNRLKGKLRTFFPNMEIDEINRDKYSEVHMLSHLFKSENCLFCGGPYANLWTLRFIHRYPLFKFRKNQYIRLESLQDTDGMVEANSYYPGFAAKPDQECGVLIVMWGWGRPNLETPATIYAAGLSRNGTFGSYLLLCDPPQKIHEALLLAKTNRNAGIQVNFIVEVSGKPRTINDIKITKIDYLSL